MTARPRRKATIGATMRPGDMPHVDFRFNMMHDLVEAHQEQLRIKNADRVTGCLLKHRSP
jgi:hypothetical protein